MGSAATVYELVVPEGAVAPGLAVAAPQEEGGALSHSVRFAMPEQGEARMRIHVSYDIWGLMGGKEQVLTVTGEAGDRWSTKLESLAWQGDGTHSGQQFLGSSSQLERFVAGVLQASPSPTRAQQVQSGLQLGDPREVPECRTLAAVPYVVADARYQGEALLRCAACGASVLLVGEQPLALRGLAPGLVTRWGRGSLAWASDFDATAGAAALVLSERTPADMGWLDYFYPGQHLLQEREGSRLGALALVLLLCFYVALIGPVGYWVGIRPRRMLLAWGWFPAVSSMAVAGAFIVHLLWHSEQQLRIVRTTVLSPAGYGLRSQQVSADAPYGKTFALSLPWQQADLAGFWPARRYGSPFGNTPGPLRIDEDSVEGKARLSGLAASSYGMASVGWVAPQQGQGPRVIPEGDGVRLLNQSPSALRRGVVALDGGFRRFEQLPAGQSLLLNLDDERRWNEAGDVTYDWIDTLLSQLEAASSLPGAYVAAVEYEDTPESQLDVEPPVPVRITDIVIVNGPLLRPAPLEPQEPLP